MSGFTNWILWNVLAHVARLAEFVSNPIREAQMRRIMGLFYSEVTHE